MSKDACLKKAFEVATANSMVNSFDPKAKAQVIKTAMLDYAKKNDVEITAQDVKAYIDAKFNEIAEGIADFTIQTKTMN